MALCLHDMQMTYSIKLLWALVLHDLEIISQHTNKVPKCPKLVFHRGSNSILSASPFLKGDTAGIYLVTAQLTSPVHRRDHLPHLSTDWKLPGEFLTPLTVFLQRTTKNLRWFCVIFLLLHLLTVLDCDWVGVGIFPSILKHAFLFSYSCSRRQYKNHGVGVFLSKALSHTRAANGQQCCFTDRSLHSKFSVFFISRL